MTTALRLLAAIGGLGFAFGMGLLTGRHFPTSASNANPEIAGLEPEIADAVYRWSLKSRQAEQSVRGSYQPRSMFIPTRNQGQGMLCIELGLKPGDLGGSPVYCYKDDFFKPGERAQLVAEYSDVE